MVSRLAAAAALALLSACSTLNTSYPVPAPTGGALFHDFRVTGHTDPAFDEAFRATGETGMVTFGPAGLSAEALAPAAGEGVMRLNATTDGTDAGTVQGQVVSRDTYGPGTTAALVRFIDAPTCGARGDRPVQAFYLASPGTPPTPAAFSEIDFEYLPHGGWSTYTDPRLHLTSWDAYGQGQRRVTNTPVNGSFDGWHLLITTHSPEQVTMTVQGAQGSQTVTYGRPYTPEMPMRVAWRSRILTQGRMPGPLRRCAAMDVDWVLHVPNETLSADEVLRAVQQERARIN